MGDLVAFPSVEKGPYDKWTYIHIDTPTEMLKEFGRDKPKSGGFDTESTGLHIIKDKPFLIQLGWKRTVFTFYPTEHLMQAFFFICERLNYVFAHNLNYDLHMLTNIGYGKEVQSKKIKWVDSQAVMRLVLEAKSARDGGDNLKLKDLGSKYVHPYAKNSEDLIKAGLKELNDRRTTVLSAALKQFDHPTNTTIKWFRSSTHKGTTSKWAATNPDESYMKVVPMKWTKKNVEDFIKDITNDVKDLPENVRELWLDWQEEYPEPTYADIDRPLMIKYAGEDIATMMMLMEFSFPTLLERKQLPMLKREMALQLPTYRMERQGLKVDREYLELSRKKLKSYIIELRTELEALCGEKVTVNQHERIKQIFDEMFNISLESSDKNVMNQIIKNTLGNFVEPARRLAILINKLRTCEKWYSTYILKVLRDSAYDGRSYTQINLNGAVSGRMSSDFQQFPKDPIKTLEGTEIFHPRQAILVDTMTKYLDFSQIELVGQAHYTILVSGGDLNLCRAFMPFKCTHFQTGEMYKFHSKEDRVRWDEVRIDGKTSVWIDEEGKAWERTDLHTLTTAKAFPHIPIDSAEFKNEYRRYGKLTNFASNYGGKAGTLVASLNISWEMATALSKGYEEAFPGVITYQNGIQKAHAKRGYVQNHYGRRYYLRDNRDAYKLANYIVQGTCADALKDCIVKIDEYLMDKKTKLVLPVHDELMYKTVPEEEHVIERCRQIMEESFDFCLVPAIADVEVSTTNWREKYEESA